MTTESELIALAERVEAATGLDRALDAAVCAVLRIGTEHAWAVKNYPAWIAAPNGWVHLEKNGPSFASPAFTASLDAAMTLVPSDPWLEIRGPRKYLNIPTRSPNFWSANVSCWNHEGQKTGWGATPALALTAAALRARSAALEEKANG